MCFYFIDNIISVLAGKLMVTELFASGLPALTKLLLAVTNVAHAGTLSVIFCFIADISVIDAELFCHCIELTLIWPRPFKPVIEPDCHICGFAGNTDIKPGSV